MGDLTKSILLGVLTIGTWIAASYFLNSPKEIIKDKKIEIELLEDLNNPL